jgi:hypothetical protein
MAIATVQTKTGYSDTGSTSRSVTLDTAPTSGNLLLAIVCPDKASGTITPPSGWTAVATPYTSGPSVSLGIYRKISNGSESGAITFSWTNAASKSLLQVIELSGVDGSSPIRTANITYVNDTAVRSRSTGTTPGNGEIDDVALAVMVNDSGMSAYGSTGDAWDNGFSLVGKYGCPQATGGNEGLWVGSKTLAAQGTVSSTLSYTGGAAADQMMGGMVVLRPSSSGPQTVTPTLAGSVATALAVALLLTVTPTTAGSTATAYDATLALSSGLTVHPSLAGSAAVAYGVTLSLATSTVTPTLAGSPAMAYGVTLSLVTAVQYGLVFPVAPCADHPSATTRTARFSARMNGAVSAGRFAIYTTADVFVADSGDLATDADNYLVGTVSGLNPSTEYQYRVTVGGLATAYEGYFTTAPAAGFLGEYRVCTISDSQYYNNGEDTVYYGRFDAVRSFDPHFMLIQGDFPHDDVNNNNALKRTRWEVALKDPATVAACKQIPVARLFGDHDMAGDNSNGNAAGAPAARTLLRQVYPIPSTAEAGNTSYYFDWGRVRTIMIDERSQRQVTAGRIFSAATMQAIKDWILEAKRHLQVVHLSCHVPWNSLSDTDTWYGYTTDRTELMDYIKSIGMQRSVWLSHGDAHMLAFDTGSVNGQYDTGATFGIPTVCTASFNRGSSTKGGPWDHGTHAGTRQFGRFTITTSSTKVTVGFDLVQSDDSVWLSDSFDLDYPALTPALAGQVAQALGVVLVIADSNTVTPTLAGQVAQALGVAILTTVTPTQAGQVAQALGVAILTTVTPTRAGQVAQALGVAILTTVTPTRAGQVAQALGVAILTTVTPTQAGQVAQALGVAILTTVTPTQAGQVAQALGVVLVLADPAFDPRRLWQHEVIPGWPAWRMLRVIAAAAAARSSGMTAGMPGTATIRSLDDALDELVANLDAHGNRLAVTANAVDTSAAGGDMPFSPAAAWDYEIMPGWSAGRMIRKSAALVAAKTAGMTSGTPATATIRTLNDDADEIVATLDAAGNRTAITVQR